MKKNSRPFLVTSMVMAGLVYQSPAIASLGTVINIIGSVCSIAGAAITAYQLGQCNNTLPTNLAQSTLSYNGDRFNFNLGFVGGDFDSDNLNQVISGTFGDGIVGVNNTFALTEPWWSWQIVLNEDAGFLNDVLSVNGFIQHVLPSPHPNPIDNAPGPQLSFNLIVDADDAVGGIVSAQQNPISAPHPGTGGHQDNLTMANLNATVSTIGFFDDITGYTFNANAVHTGDTESLPPTQPAAPGGKTGFYAGTLPVPNDNQSYKFSNPSIGNNQNFMLGSWSQALDPAQQGMPGNILGIPQTQNYVGDLFTIMAGTNTPPGNYTGAFTIDRQLVSGASPLQSGGTETLTFSFNVQVVPEPLTILGAGTAAGFGAFFKRELNKSKKKQKDSKSA